MGHYVCVKVEAHENGEVAAKLVKGAGTLPPVIVRTGYGLTPIGNALVELRKFLNCLGTLT